MNLFLFLLKASRRTVWLATAIGVISGLATVGLISLIHRSLQEPGWQTPGGWIFIGLCLLVLISRVVSQVLLTRLSQHSISRLIRHLCDRVLDAPLRHLEEVGSSRLLAALTTDVTIIAQALNGLPTIGVSLIILVACILYLGWLSAPIFAAALLFLIMGVVSYRLTNTSARHYLELGREHMDDLMHYIELLLDGVKELKIHQSRREAYLSELLHAADAQVREHHIKGFTIQASAANWGRLLFFIAIGLLLFAWPNIRQVDPATLTAYVLVILYLMAPLERIMAWLPLMSRARVALRKLEQLRLTLEHGEHTQLIRDPPSSWEKLELQEVTYTYHREADGHDFQLGPLSLRFSPGELVFIIGGNGSGKTTLAKLITGLYVPNSGMLLWDGRPVDGENRHAYRQLFTTLFADTPVFEEFVGLPHHGLERRAQEYLAELELTHKVTIEDGKFSTTDLSKGQQRRLALLIAYLEDRSLYLLDEWAADQDPVFRNVFYRKLLPDLKGRGKTIIVITHDDSYFTVADRIIELREGKLWLITNTQKIPLVAEIQGANVRMRSSSEHFPSEKGITL